MLARYRSLAGCFDALAEDLSGLLRVAGGRRSAERSGHRQPDRALDGRQEHDLRRPDVLLRRVAVFNESMKPIKIGVRNGKRNTGLHPADSHAATPPGIRPGIQLSDLIH